MLLADRLAALETTLLHRLWSSVGITHSIEEVSGPALKSENARVDGGGASAGDGVVDPTASASSVDRDVVTPPDDLWFRRQIDFRTAVRDVWRFRELILSLAERDYRARYKQALLGIAWSLLTPVMLMVVFTLVFTKIRSFDTHGVPYPLFAYLGLLPWTFFSNSVINGGQSIVNNMSLVNKVACPREVFGLAGIAVAAVDTLISSAVLVLLFAITGFVPHLEAVYAPVLLAVLLVYTVGLTLGISAAVVYFRDLRQILPLAVQLGLFLTPVAYGMEVIAHTRSKLMIYSFLNPVAPVIDGFRRTILYGLPPDWGLLGAGAAGAILVFAGGYIVFKRLEVGIADIA